MSENGEVIQQQPEPYTLLITLDAIGQINIQFPHNQIVALGMLEFAYEFLMLRTVRPSMQPAVQHVTQMPQIVRN